MNELSEITDNNKHTPSNILINKSHSAIQSTLRIFQNSKINLPNPCGKTEIDFGVWNDPIICKRSNCFDFAMNTPRGEGQWDSSCVSNFMRLKETIKYGSVYGLLRALRREAIRQNRYFKQISFEEKCPAGSYKIAVVASTSNFPLPKLIKGVQGDIHFYREDNQGTWWHKMGRGKNVKIISDDASHKEITNPEQADRDYTNCEDGYSYNLFVGYFAIGANEIGNNKTK